MNKYFKPKSLTWWAATAPLVGGAIVATTPLHGQFDLAEVVNNISGNAEPGVLINAGLLGIGLRGAIQ